MTENEVRRQVIDGLEARGYEVLPTHDAKHRPMVAGISDLIAVGQNRVLFVECKRPGEKATDEQAAFLVRMRGRGHAAFVATSWDDCRRHV